MFGLGFTEILLIAVVALLFIGPDKLPDTMKNIARTFGKIKRALDDTKSTLEQELRVDDLRQEVLQYRAELDRAKDDLSSFKNVAAKEISSVKKSAQIESYNATDINDDKLFDDLFEEADSDFAELEDNIKADSKKEPKGFKNLKEETPKKEDSSTKDSTKIEDTKEITPPIDRAKESITTKKEASPYKEAPITFKNLDESIS